MITLHIRQDAQRDGLYPIRLTLKRSGQPDLEAVATIEFALTPQERGELRWYMEDYLTVADSVPEVQVEQIEDWMKRRGEELYSKVLAFDMGTQAIWFAVREQLADLRVEITAGVAEAASIPWELMRDPQSDSAIALRVQAFVRVHSDPNINFVKVSPAEDGRIRLLYVVCRPGGRNDVELRAVANRLLQDLGDDLRRFEVTALRPPTFEQLQKELLKAKEAKRPYHIVHFDGHGTYEDLSKTTLADWLKAINALTLGDKKKGKHGYLLFEHPDSELNMRPVPGDELGRLLHDNDVPVLVLNACQSAMHEAVTQEKQGADSIHDEVRAIGSLAQAVVDQGIPAVLGMRYSVFVVTAAQYIGQLYAALAQGRPFGQAASEGRKHLALNPDRWVGLQPRPLQDWFVPVVYEAAPLRLLSAGPSSGGLKIDLMTESDPVLSNQVLLRYVPDTGFVGRDETLLMLDRAFDRNSVVLLHAYAGQGKSSTAIEFARWYARTGGLLQSPVVLFTSFESHTDLTDVLNQIGQAFATTLRAGGTEWYAVIEPAERLSIVLQILQQVPVMWIWDNVELIAGFPAGAESAWAQEEQTELADFLKQIKLDKASKAKILLTSRRSENQWLGGIPQRIHMPRMSGSDAANLARSLGSERQISRENVAEWQPLLNYCNGNPLTLRVLVSQAIRMGLNSRKAAVDFVEALRDGEQAIKDADEREGRDKSLGASLDYGFRNAFRPEEQPVIALLHLFQSIVDIDALYSLGNMNEYPFPEINGKTREELSDILDRGVDAGLLTHHGGSHYIIHPALPWFLQQLFLQHFDGQEGRTSSESALRAWVDVISSIGNYYTGSFATGNRSAVQKLVVEESNLLRAIRIGRGMGLWHSVVSAMQGLRVLYHYQGRRSEWRRLVDDIKANYCNADDTPVDGMEPEYLIVIGYIIDIATEYDHDLLRASVLLEKAISVDLNRTSYILSLHPDVPLDSEQKNAIRSLGVSVLGLGQIQLAQGDPKCLDTFRQTISYDERIQDLAAQSIAYYNLGSAYKDVPIIRNLDQALAAYQKSLELRRADDRLGQSRCIKQMGMVHQDRLVESLERNEPVNALEHAKAAEKLYLESIDLIPSDAVAEIGGYFGQLATLYTLLDLTELARENFEKAAGYFEATGDHHFAGITRANMAIMYAGLAQDAADGSGRRDLLSRAEAYVCAAISDFQLYEGRLAEKELDCQRLLSQIRAELAELP